MSLREDITNTIIRIIESGAARGSSSPLWDAGVSLGLPVNFSTRLAYSGINVPLLWGAAQERGLERNEWLTFKQALALGGSVRKGSKGVLCAFFKMTARGDSGNAEGGSDSTDSGRGRALMPMPMPMLKPFWLFNVADIDGLAVAPATALIAAGFDPVERAEQLLARTGVPITWGGTRAFYRPSTDEIFLPSRERFSSPTNAYAVALHEATHSTGHPSRLARDFGKRFGTDAYAFEELVAELGSAFLVAHLGLVGARLEHHASYIESWLRVLRSDPTAVFAASRQASAAFRFLVGGESEEDTAEPELLAA